KIPVVYIPDPNSPPGTRPDLQGQKPHENQVLQTILFRNPPPVLTWAGNNNGDTPVVTAGQRFIGGSSDDYAEFAGAAPMLGDMDGEGMAENFNQYGLGFKSHESFNAPIGGVRLKESLSKSLADGLSRDGRVLSRTRYVAGGARGTELAFDLPKRRGFSSRSR